MYKKIGVNLTLVDNMFATSPERMLKHYHVGLEVENAVWHFMHPTKLLDLDEFYIHQQLGMIVYLYLCVCVCVSGSVCFVFCIVGFFFTNLMFLKKN